ncbi:hypothetical protein SAMN05421789_104260 [Kaistella chaponensis]|uniref:Uncharacterized protein n=1 Tax=Kaistella chaponensis TaxID=713588 RepID=A0A1N7L6J4_9FLAO|nr:hypothetical protein SAMN05421789_104260 [Kaistella chaponensis]
MLKFSMKKFRTAKINIFLVVVFLYPSVIYTRYTYFKT